MESTVNSIRCMENLDSSVGSLNNSIWLVELLECLVELYDFSMHFIELSGCLVELFEFSIHLVELSKCLPELFEFSILLVTLSGCLANLSSKQLQIFTRICYPLPHHHTFNIVSRKQMTRTLLMHINEYGHKIKSRDRVNIFLPK